MAMHPQRKRRWMIILCILRVAGLAAGLLGSALKENINLFYPPTDIAAGTAPIGKAIRAGGMVKEGSVERATDSLKIRFVVTDFSAEVTVEYEGLLADLFAEGEGVVVSGKLAENGDFYASEVLAKHDETYMPPEVSDALKNSAAQRAELEKKETP
jgi:cytochrome c-type biogenesis protein CcmE